MQDVQKIKMVRVNIINPKYLADQHLRAEYLEIIMLVTYVRKHPKIKKELPKKYCLGTGHILFFKDGSMEGQGFI